MGTRKQIVGICLVLVAFLMACAPKAAPASSPQAPAPVAKAAPAPARAVPVAPARPAWQDEWEKTLAAAKREGSVVITSTAAGELRAALAKGPKDVYGITAEVLSGRTAETLPKQFAERKAGLYLKDINLSGLNAILTSAKPGGILEPLDSAFILPEVTDPKYWYRGQFPWVDKDHTLVRFSLHPNVPMAINTDLVKPDEVKSWHDLLAPKWKGKLVFNDPTLAGAGQQGFQGIESLMGLDYLKELVKQEPIVMRDQRLQLDWLAHGKASVVIVPTPEVLIEFIKVAAPIAVVVPQEGAWLSSGTAGVSWFNRAPHPNATKVYLNWLASKQGQEVYVPLAWHQSLRLDVSTAHLPSWRIRTEGVKYFDANTEEATLRAGGVQNQAKEILGPLMK